jgi:hypothetical protein
MRAPSPKWDWILNILQQPITLYSSIDAHSAAVQQYVYLYCGIWKNRIKKERKNGKMDERGFDDFKGAREKFVNKAKQ